MRFKIHLGWSSSSPSSWRWEGEEILWLWLIHEQQQQQRQEELQGQYCHHLQAQAAISNQKVRATSRSWSCLRNTTRITKEAATPPITIHIASLAACARSCASSSSSSSSWLSAPSSFPFCMLVYPGFRSAVSNSRSSTSPRKSATLVIVLVPQERSI